MLTTKVVSNKKPPLLSDSESGGSTSHNKRNTLHLKQIKNAHMEIMARKEVENGQQTRYKRNGKESK